MTARAKGASIVAAVAMVGPAASPNPRREPSFVDLAALLRAP
jgi:hypothetical protein